MQYFMVILPYTRMDHKIYNKTHFKSFINKEWGKEKVECTVLSKRNLVREVVGWAYVLFKCSSAHVYRGLCSHVTHPCRLYGRYTCTCKA